MDTVAVLHPFLSVIVAPETNAAVTDTALQAVHKFLVYGHVRAHSLNAAQAVSEIALVVAQCRFDATSEEEAEVVYMKSLEVLCECLRCPAGELLTDDAVCAMLTQCYAVRSRPGISKLLRRHADNTLLQMVLVIFARLSPHTHAGGSAVIESGDGPRSGVLTRRSSSRSSPDLRAAAAADERKAVGIGIAVDAAESRGDGDHTPYGIETMRRVLKFLVKLMDPRREQTTPETVELGCRLVRTAFETAGANIGDHPPLVKVIQGELCKHLLQNSQTTNPMILSLTLRIVFDLFNAVKKHLKVQLEVFFTSIHMRIGGSEGSPYEARELVLESLVEFCNDTSLIVGLYRNYDCEVGSTNLFEDLCKFLATTALPPQLRSQQKRGTSAAAAAAAVKEGAVNRLHILSFEGILAMLHSLARRFGPNADPEDPDAKLGPSEVALRKAGLSAEETRRLDRNRRRKQQLMVAATHFNKQGRKAFKYIEGLGLLQDAGDAAEITRFLRSTPGLDLKRIGEFIGGANDLQQRVMKLFIRQCALPFPKSPPFYPKESSDPAAPTTATTRQPVPITPSPTSKSAVGAPEEAAPAPVVHVDDTGVWVTGRVDRGLRAILENFHLPAESQQIARILEEFSEYFFGYSPGPVRDKDAAYVLTFAVMMLHTDAHNPRVVKKMTREKFVSTLRGTNQGKNFPPKYLYDIYDEITSKEIKVLSWGPHGPKGDFKSMGDDAWNTIVRKSRSTGPFQVCIASPLPPISKYPTTLTLTLTLKNQPLIRRPPPLRPL